MQGCRVQGVQGCVPLGPAVVHRHLPLPCSAAAHKNTGWPRAGAFNWGRVVCLFTFMVKAG